MNQKKLLEKLVKERTGEIEEKNRLLYEQADALNETNTLLEERQQQIEEQAEQLRTQAEYLEDTNKNLLELNEIKDKFFSIIAHDLRNPFTSLIGLSEMLNKNHSKFDKKDLERITQNIFLAAKSTFDLLENLLEWARIQTNKISFVPRSVCFNGICKEIIEHLQPNCESKNIRMIFTLKEDLFVTADVNMVKTILRNLVTNAIKFTDKNGAIEIKASKNEDYATITISDNGVGMDEKNRSRLFDSFQQFSNTGTRGEKGTGLGLMLCKEFVEKHDGKIWVESELGKGSDFKFTLPL